MTTGDAAAFESMEQGDFLSAIKHFQVLERRATEVNKKVDYLVCQGNCWREIGDFEKARICASAARTMTSEASEARIEVDFFVATLLIDEGKKEKALEELSRLLEMYKAELKTTDFRELYENLQVQRAFIMMQLDRRAEGRELLEEASAFDLLQPSASSSVHCHLAREYVERSEYERARQHFLRAQALGISPEWSTNFHYYLGYAYYELGDYRSALRQLILGLQSTGEGPPISFFYKLLAATSRRLGDKDGARAYRKKAKEMESES